MDNQLELFPTLPNPKAEADKLKRRWENGFQRWSNKMSQSKIDQPLGCCGCGSMCDYCEDNTFGRPCVRALNEMCRRKKITIDYAKTSYEEAWWGRFDNG